MENEREEGTWIACRQQDGRGVFMPLPVDWTLRSDDMLPTAAALAEIAAPVHANVALPGGESGEVEGYLTGDGDLYVCVPDDVLESLMFRDATAGASR